MSNTGANTGTGTDTRGRRNERTRRTRRPRRTSTPTARTLRKFENIYAEVVRRFVWAHIKRSQNVIDEITPRFDSAIKLFTKTR